MVVYLQVGIPFAVELVVVLLMLPIIIGIPTWGMYRDSTRHDVNHATLWTASMFLISIILPVVGPIALWLLYTAVAVRG